METIGKWNSRELELGREFDKEQELELTILDKDRDYNSIWLNVEEVKQLIEHLQNVLFQLYMEK